MIFIIHCTLLLCVKSDATQRHNFRNATTIRQELLSGEVGVEPKTRGVLSLAHICLVHRPHRPEPERERAEKMN